MTSTSSPTPAFSFAMPVAIVKSNVSRWTKETGGLFDAWCVTHYAYDTQGILRIVGDVVLTHGRYYASRWDGAYEKFAFIEHAEAFIAGK